MKPTLKPGLKYSFSYTVPENKTVPYTYPESPEIAAMPKVFATGYMIVLMEWTCLQLMAPHLGMTVTVDAECIAVEGRKVTLTVRAHDGVDVIGEGTHQRAVVVWDKFNARVAEKASAAGVA